MAGLGIAFKFDLSHLKVGPFGGEAGDGTALKYFGYWKAPWSYNEPEEAEEVRSFSNMVVMGYDENWSETELALWIDRRWNQGYKIIFQLAGWFFYNHAEPENEWRDFLNELKTELGENSEKIWAFYLADEPEIQGIKPEELNRFTNLTKEFFPDIYTLVVFYVPKEGFSNVLKNKNLDLIGTDPYFLTTDSYACDEQNKQKFDNEVRRRMNWIKSNWRGGDQKIILTGQAFKCRHDWKYMPSACQQKWYYDYAESDSDIIGLLWYMYSSEDLFASYNEGKIPCLGIGRHTPEILEAHKEWGLEVLFPEITPIGLSPSAEPLARVLTTTPTFEWRAVGGAAKYELWISYKETPHEALYRTAKITETEYTLLFDNALEPEKEYSWWVRGISPKGRTTQWSTRLDFSIPKPNEYWASSASATSEYNSYWDVGNGVGESGGADVCSSWVIHSAWCKKPLDGKDTITLKFDRKIRATKIELYLAGPKGNYDIEKVELMRSDDRGGIFWETVWQGTNNLCMLGISGINSYLTDTIRVTTKSGSWGCVDAVKLIGWE